MVPHKLQPFSGFKPSFTIVSVISFAAATNLSASAEVIKYMLTLSLPSPRSASKRFANCTRRSAAMFPPIYSHSPFFHPTTMTPSAPFSIALNINGTSIKPVHGTLTILIVGGYCILETPAKSAAA